jgi:hypothetical protein
MSKNIREPPLDMRVSMPMFSLTEMNGFDFRSPLGTAHLAKKVLVPFAGREGRFLRYREAAL